MKETGIEDGKGRTRNVGLAQKGEAEEENIQINRPLQIEQSAVRAAAEVINNKD